ncbi:hypothetical protein F5876DRAFT_70296 [Lentinula aff. lateritia]|uniref:Uncharacterized protein n=1 Tax=Lentinula aff. lateritia TaxID=2804960 RepID=A0ACC1TJQ5_9AGAR|nr:hypothetical protein F5876DRAFT_70296 [Lentinula aff. lateritia]
MTADFVQYSTPLGDSRASIRIHYIIQGETHAKIRKIPKTVGVCLPLPSSAAQPFSRTNAIMSKTQAQAVLLSMACAILAASDTLDNVEDADLPLDDPCEDLEVLEVVAAIMIHEALEIKGDGTRGPYNQFPKSRDWFPTSLQQPDQWFRSNYRMSWDMFDCLVFMLAPILSSFHPKRDSGMSNTNLQPFLYAMDNHLNSVLGWVLYTCTVVELLGHYMSFVAIMWAG